MTNDCLWEWDVNTMELFWIDNCHKRNFDYDIENALIPRRFWDNRIHPEDKDRVLEKLNKSLFSRNGFIWQNEYRFQKANGDFAYVQDRGCIICEGKRSCACSALQET
jgi:hypothetical protein